MGGRTAPPSTSAAESALHVRAGRPGDSPPDREFGASPSHEPNQDGHLELNILVHSVAPAVGPDQPDTFMLPGGRTRPDGRQPAAARRRRGANRAPAGTADACALHPGDR